MNWITAAIIAAIAVAIGAYLFLTAPAPVEETPGSDATEQAPAG